MNSPPYTVVIHQEGVPTWELRPAGAALIATALSHLAESCRRIPGRLDLAWRAETLLDLLSKVNGIRPPRRSRARMTTLHPLP